MAKRGWTGNARDRVQVGLVGDTETLLTWSTATIPARADPRRPVTPAHAAHAGGWDRPPVRAASAGKTPTAALHPRRGAQLQAQGRARTPAVWARASFAPVLIASRDLASLGAIRVARRARHSRAGACTGWPPASAGGAGPGRALTACPEVPARTPSGATHPSLRGERTQSPKTHPRLHCSVPDEGHQRPCCRYRHGRQNPHPPPSKAYPYPKL